MTDAQGHSSKILFAETISNFGNQISFVATPVAIAAAFELNPTEFGVILASQRISYIIFSLTAGWLADSSNSAKIISLSDISRAILIGVIGWLAAKNNQEDVLPVLCLIYILLGAFNCLHSASLSAIISTVTNKVASAVLIRKLSTFNSVGELTGPMVAAIIISSASMAASFVVDAITFIISGLIYFHISSTFVGSTPPRGRSQRTIKNDISAGWTEIINNQYLYPLLASSLIWGLLLQISIVNFPLAYLTTHHGSPEGFGLIMAASGSGFLFGSTALNAISERFSIHLKMYLGLIVFYFACLLTPIALQVADKITYCSAAFFLGGIGVSFYIISLSTMRQICSPEGLAGRISAAFQLVSNVSMGIGAIVGGIVGSEFSPDQAIATMALLGLLFTFFHLFIFRSAMRACTHFLTSALSSSKRNI